MRTDFQPAVRRLNTRALTVVAICAVALNVARLNNIKEFRPTSKKAQRLRNNNQLINAV
jgi:hypothetical protein